MSHDCVSKARLASVCAQMKDRDSSTAYKIGQDSREIAVHGYVSELSPTKHQQKRSAARSQSARVVGSSKPRIRKIETGLLVSALTSSDGALTSDIEDCKYSYNPFLRETGKFVANYSVKMSNSTQGILPLPVPVSTVQKSPRNSPKSFRKQYERRGSDKAAREREKKGAIPFIATPECSPILSSTRRHSFNKPLAIPRSPQLNKPNNMQETMTSKGSSKAVSLGSHLDVPEIDVLDDEEEESYRLRTFNTTPKGIVNRGDSFRRRRSRSNSLIPTSATTPEVPRSETFVSEDGFLLPNSTQFSQLQQLPLPSSKESSCAEQNRNRNKLSETARDSCVLESYRVAMIGARGVGKAALVRQFMTSDDAYDRLNDVEGEETVSIMLNGMESELTFFKMHNPKIELNRDNPPEAFLLVYSVVDRSTYQKIEAELRLLEEWDLVPTKAVIIVGNKIDLARRRAVTTQDGRCLAASFRVKFIEISVGINHKVDELLVGILHQIRLKKDQTEIPDAWRKHRGMFRASVKARQMLTWLLGKEDSKLKNCENLHIL